MLCDRCHKNEATVHIVQIVNGNKKEENLCQHCAAQEESLNWNHHSMFGRMGSMFGSMFGDSLFRDIWSEPGTLSGSQACGSCGTTLDTFREKGKLGCPECYSALRDSLRPFYKNSQEGTTHIGKKPGDDAGKTAPADNPQMAAFQKKLDALIAEEKYEEAAKVRDEMKKLEGEHHDNG